MNDKNIFDTYDRISKMIADCQIDFKQCLNEVGKKVVSEQYGFGGECLHRGYYCPSLILDIVVGNLKRGRVQRHKSNIKHHTYTYKFNNENKLIFIEQSDSYEFVFCHEQYEFGIGVFKDDMQIQYISECQYDGAKIKSYIFCLWNPYEKEIVELAEENYEYSHNKLHVDLSRICKSGLSCVEDYEQFTFSVVNGFLVSYTVQYCDSNGHEKESVYNNHIFKVKLKRKIDDFL